MSRDDGIRYGAGGKPMLKSDADEGTVPTKSTTLAERESAKLDSELLSGVEVLEETVRDTLPSDVEPEGDEDEDV